MPRILLIAAVLLISTSGCTPASKLYVESQSIDSNPELVRINFERAYRIAGSGNALMLVDTGSPLFHDSVLATKYPTTYYLGPINKGLNSESVKPVIGDSGVLCGFEFSDVKKSASGDLTGKYKDICPNEEGHYKVYSSWAGAVLLGFTHTITTGGVAYKVRYIEFNYKHALIIGESSSREPLSWTRPAGKMELYAIGCLASCGGESQGWPAKRPLSYDLVAGKEYFIRGGFSEKTFFEISDKPFASEQIDVSASNLELMFSNKTVSGTHEKEGYVFKRYFSIDGTIYGENEKNGTRQGKWRASSKGLCVQWAGKKEKCRIVTRENNYIKKYKINKKGKRVLVTSYSSFETSNMLNTTNNKKEASAD